MNRFTFSGWLMATVISASLSSIGCAVFEPARRAEDIAQFAPPPVTAAQVDTVIRVQPPIQQLNLGDFATVEIWIDNITNLAAADIELKFDANILQVQDADLDQEGTQIEPGDFPVPDFVAVNKADNVTGGIFYVVTQVGSTPPANGSGLLATVTFQALAEGTSQLTFTRVELVAVTDGVEEIPVTPQSGQITVGQPTGEPTAIPTSTSTPTSTTVPGQPTSTPTITPIPGVDTPTPTLTLLPEVPTSTPPLVLPTPTSTVLPTPTLAPSPTNTPISPVSKIPPGATLGFCYRVQARDTLYSLGQKFGVAPHFINLVNDLNPPGYIFQNQALFIPEQYGYGPNVYITKQGDTLTSIADACHLPMAFLAQVNKLDQAATLPEKLALIIPIPPFPPPSRFPYPPSVFPGPYY